MLESQLNRYPFFKKLGAFGFDPQSPADTLKTFHYMKTLAQDPDNLLIFYPQGTISSYEDVNLKKGLSIFLNKFPIPSLVWPIHFRIQYENQKTPALYCRFGPLLKSQQLASDFFAFEDTFLSNLAHLTQDIHTKTISSSLWSKKC